MLSLVKIGAIAIIFWFYQSAKKYGENSTKWAVVGLIGYCLVAALSYFAVFKLVPITFIKSGLAGFLVTQVPALIAICASVLIRKRLIAASVEEK